MNLSEILKRHNPENPINIFPFWKLVITEEEYQRLKQSIKGALLGLQDNIPCDRAVNSLRDYILSAAVFYSEWYRREYAGGNFSERDIVVSLVGNDIRLDYYYEVLKALVRKIFDLRFNNESIETLLGDDNRTHRFYSLLYQGGLPIGYIENHLANNGDFQENRAEWKTFARNLLSREHDFQYLPSRLALRSKSYQSFCRAFINAIRQQDITLLPFKTNSSFWKDNWGILTGQVELAKREYNPFFVNWFVSLDKNRQRICFKFKFSGPRRLNEEYRQRHDIGDNYFLRFEYNGKVVTGEYFNNFSIYGFNFDESIYDGQSEIRIIKDDVEDELLYKESLDITIPRLIHLNRDTRIWEVTHRIEQNYTYVILPQGWEVIDCPFELSQETYQLNDTTSYTLIPWTFNEQASLKITNGTDTLPIGKHSMFRWTELGEPMNASRYFVEDLYAVDENMEILVCDGLSEATQVEFRNVRYRIRHTTEWSDEPVLGCTSAKVTSEDDVYIKDSRFFYNMGCDVSVVNHANILDRNKEALLEFQWELGTIEPVLGNKEGSYWKLTIEDCNGYDTIPVRCTPTGSVESFDLHLHLPFKEFHIYDSLQNAITNDSVLPLDDLRNYYYKAKNARGTITCNYKLTSSEETIIENRQIEATESDKFESLSSLLPANNEISRVHFEFSPGLSISVSSISFIKNPYFVRCDKEKGTLEVFSGSRNNPGPKADYADYIKILSFSDISKNCLLTLSEDGFYHLPSNIQEFGGSLILGVRSGILKPQFEDFSITGELNREQRNENFINTPRRIANEMTSQNIDGKIWEECLYWLKQDNTYKIGAYRDRNGDVQHYIHQLDALKDTSNLSKFIAYCYLTSNNDDDIWLHIYFILSLLRSLDITAQIVSEVELPAADFYLNSKIYLNWCNNNRFTNGDFILKYQQFKSIIANNI